MFLAKLANLSYSIMAGYFGKFLEMDKKRPMLKLEELGNGQHLKYGFCNKSFQQDETLNS